MARRPGVYGPYKHGNRWRVHLVNAEGETFCESCVSEKEALAFKERTRLELEQISSTTIREAIELYEEKRRVDGDRKVSYLETTRRMNEFFAAQIDERVSTLTQPQCAANYEGLVNKVNRFGRKMAVDSHRNMLGESRTFLKWCVEKKWTKENPLDGVEGVGKRRHGKPQLRIDEARRWMAAAFKAADSGEMGAVAALMALLMGMRASEIVRREVRDLDDDGKLIWIPETKTEAGKRNIEVPEILQPYLRQVARDKLPTAFLFNGRHRRWVNDWVQKLCDLAEVAEVTAHGMRGLFGTLAMSSGTASHVVAASLGHESITTTLESYADKGVVDASRQRATVSWLRGDK